MTTEEKLKYIEAFTKLPTANVSDAMDQLGMPRNVILGLRSIVGEGTVSAGFALTIQEVHRNVSAAPSKLNNGIIIDEQVTPGDLIVVDTGNYHSVGTIGGIQMMIAKLRGASGYMTNGCIRDIDEVRGVGLPAYCAAVSPVKSGLDLETIAVNVPVTINNVQVRNGDFVMMDSSGILVMPVERLDEILEVAQKIQRREDRMIELLKAGHSLAEARVLAKQ